jgi:hypothetical protein
VISGLSKRISSALAVVMLTCVGVRVGAALVAPLLGVATVVCVLIAIIWIGLRRL